jgi:hypothetical protein
MTPRRKKHLDMKFAILIASFIITACSSVQLPPAPMPPVIDNSKLLAKPLEEREVKSLPTSTFGKKALLKGEVAQGDGVLLDEREVARLGLVKLERDNLRSEILSERILKEKSEYLYTKALWEYQVKLIQAQPSWWERHDGKIGLFVGFALGSLAAIGIAFGINRVIVK